MGTDEACTGAYSEGDWEALASLDKNKQIRIREKVEGGAPDLPIIESHWAYQGYWIVNHNHNLGHAVI